MEESSTKKSCGLLGWFIILRDAYTGKYLVAVFCFQHVLKGFVAMYAYTSFDFLLRIYHVRGPQMQVFKTVILLPWALKPLLGIVSDTLPVFGYRKAPYIVIASLFGFVGFWMVGHHGTTLPLGMLVACFFAMSVQIVSCDLLVEAATAERLRRQPHYGPAMMMFVTGGITACDIFASASVGSVLMRWGANGPCLFCILPSALMLVPALTNCLGEEAQSKSATQKSRALFWHQREVLILVAVMAVASLTLAGLGVTDLLHFVVVDEMTKLKVVISVALIIMGSFALLLNPVIGLMNAFFFLQSTSTISVEGGSFYFFTDDITTFPRGPHFSVWFYTTGLGLAASGCGLAGIWVYGQFMTNWRYRSIFLFCNFSWSLVSLATVLVFTRYNVALGIPDYAFVLGGTVLQNVFERWTYLPAGILLSQVCPRGMEATMFALLAGCSNLGRGVASYFGAFMLEYLDITPDGTARDETQFANLWLAALFQALAPLITLWLVPTMIPDAAQTDKILDDGAEASAATQNSLWQQLRAFYTGTGADCHDGCTGTAYGSAEHDSSCSGDSTGGCESPKCI